MQWVLKPEPESRLKPERNFEGLNFESFYCSCFWIRIVSIDPIFNLVEWYGCRSIVIILKNSCLCARCIPPSFDFLTMNADMHFLITFNVCVAWIRNANELWSQSQSWGWNLNITLRASSLTAPCSYWSGLRRRGQVRTHDAFLSCSLCFFPVLTQDQQAKPSGELFLLPTH